eukprot:365412-Chlamydomonas_euryale.AAC.20
MVAHCAVEQGPQMLSNSLRQILHVKSFIKKISEDKGGKVSTCHFCKSAHSLITLAHTLITSELTLLCHLRARTPRSPQSSHF